MESRSQPLVLGSGGPRYSLWVSAGAERSHLSCPWLLLGAQLLMPMEAIQIPAHGLQLSLGVTPALQQAATSHKYRPLCY